MRRKRRTTISVQSLAAGRYRVEEVLGRGGMATVYLAHDEELDRPVAVKQLAEHLASDESFRERFLREARIAAQLAHPNIVSVFDAGEDNGVPFIVMEYVEGETLADALAREGKLSPARTVDLALQVCGGLEHAHAAGLVHRDVKPQNLLLRGDGTVKIADFGIARAAEATKLTQIGTVLGTAAYLAPEQAAGEQVTAAADLYSLGAVLFELLTGRTPYEFQSITELVVKQLEQPITPIRELAPEVPEALEDVVMGCLARNPDYRPPSAAELARQLALASPEPPTQPLPESTGTDATQVRQVASTRVAAPVPEPLAAALQRNWVWLALASAATLIVIGLALAAGGDGDEQPAGGRERPAVPAAPNFSGDLVPRRGGTPNELARNIAAWLRAHSE